MSAALKPDRTRTVSYTHLDVYKRQRVVCVGPSELLVAREPFGWKRRQRGIEGGVEGFQSVGIAGEFVGVDEADGDFVVGIRRETVALVKVGRDGGGVCADEALDLLLRLRVARGGVVAR